MKHVLSLDDLYNIHKYIMIILAFHFTINMFYLTVNNSQTLFHNVNTYSEFYYQLFEPLPATEDWEVTLHFKMSAPKKSRRVSILPNNDTIVKGNDLSKSNTEQEN